MEPVAQENKLANRTSRRIRRLTLILGFAAAIAVFFLKSRSAGAGIALGTVLAWLNYRWLDQALVALEKQATAQAGSPAARVPLRIYAKAGGRYLLIGVAIYVTVHYFAVPLESLIAGLLALGAGAIVGTLYEVIAGS